MDQLLSAQTGKNDLLAYRNFRWYRQRRLCVDLPKPRHSIYRQRGIYLVIGGAGGLGEVWSELVIRNYQAQVIWLGRRPLDSSIKAKQARLSSFGPRPYYISADAGNRQMLKSAQKEIYARFGTLHGIIHSALVLHNQSLTLMEETNFRKSYDTKVNSSVYSAQLFDSHDLDFVLIFSSITALLSPPRQGNYAAGCCFQDSWAQMLSKNRPNTPVKVINWGFWGNIGVVAADKFRNRMSFIGVDSIEPSEGLPFLEALVISPFNQLTAIKMQHSPKMELLKIDRNNGLFIAPTQENIR